MLIYILEIVIFKNKSIYIIYMNAGIENCINKKYITDCKNYIINVKSFTISKKFINMEFYYLGYSSINGRYEYKKMNSMRKKIYPVSPYNYNYSCDNYFINISNNIKIVLNDDFEITDDEFNNYINNTFDNLTHLNNPNSNDDNCDAILISC